jgi:hypothetical protein
MNMSIGRPSYRAGHPSDVEADAEGETARAVRRSLLFGRRVERRRASEGTFAPASAATEGTSSSGGSGSAGEAREGVPRPVRVVRAPAGRGIRNGLGAAARIGRRRGRGAGRGRGSGDAPTGCLLGVSYGRQPEGALGAIVIGRQSCSAPGVVKSRRRVTVPDGAAPQCALAGLPPAFLSKAKFPCTVTGYWARSVLDCRQIS